MRALKSNELILEVHISVMSTWIDDNLLFKAYSLLYFSKQKILKITFSKDFNE